MTQTAVLTRTIRPRCSRNRRKPGAGVEQRIYAGHEYDSASGLSYMGARYYDPSIGRFLSEDPVHLELGGDMVRSLAQYGYGRKLQDLLSNPQELNSYSYATNNPLINIDPDGLATVMIRQAGPWNSGSMKVDEMAGHTMVKVGGTYYGFAPTGTQGNDVQQMSQAFFDQQYSGQNWNAVDIGDQHDGQIVAGFAELKG